MLFIQVEHIGIEELCSSPVYTFTVIVSSDLIPTCPNELASIIAGRYDISRSLILQSLFSPLAPCC